MSPTTYPKGDLWGLHCYEPHYRRELTNPQTLAAYAMSPSTQEVVYVRPQGGSASTKDGRPEFRVYGPNDSLVWYVIPEKPSFALLAALEQLGWALLMKDKFKVY